MIKNFNIKNSKIGLFSDIHIGLGQDSTVWYKNILEFAEWVKDLYISKNISEIIIPGDIFHNRNEISVNTLNTAKEFFKILKDFTIYISTGNHDCYYKDRSDVNSISLLDGWNNISVIDKDPQILTVSGSKKTISLIPWGVEYKDIPQTDICIGHFEIVSFKLNSFNICDHGTESKDLLSKSPFIISGHFHQKAHRVYDNGQILYLGSPYQQNFGDANDIRGVYILDLKTNEFEFIENNISPVHVKISLKNLVDKKIDSKFLKESVPGNMVSLVVDINYPSEKISLLASKLQTLNPKFFRLDYQNNNDSPSLSEDRGEYDSIDIPQNIHDFVQALEINHKQDTINYLNDLYTKLAI